LAAARPCVSPHWTISPTAWSEKQRKSVRFRHYFANEGRVSRERDLDSAAKPTTWLTDNSCAQGHSSGINPATSWSTSVVAWTWTEQREPRPALEQALDEIRRLKDRL